MSTQKISDKLFAGRLTTIISVVINLGLACTKTTIGSLTGSTALIADGIHSVADLVTDIFAYIMLKVSHAEPDDSHPYGHGKFETFGTLALAVILSITSILIGWEALAKLFSGTPLPQLGWIAIGAAAISIFANEFLYRFCKHWGEKVNAPIIIANAWHHRTDSLSSLAALIGIAANMSGFPQGDAMAALVVTALLLRMSYSIGRRAFDELVDAAVDKSTLKKIKSIIHNTSGVINTHHLRARYLGSNIIVDVHIDVPNTISVSEGHSIAESVEENLQEQFEKIEDITVHVDPHLVNQIPLPVGLNRDIIEPQLKEIIHTHCPDNSLSSLTMHLLDGPIKAIITLSGQKDPTKIQLKSLKEKIIVNSQITEVIFKKLL